MSMVELSNVGSCSVGLVSVERMRVENYKNSFTSKMIEELRAGCREHEKYF